MAEPRLGQLADVLVGHSLALAAGEKVLIETFDVPDDCALALIDRVLAAGAQPFVERRSLRVLRALYAGATPDALQAVAGWELDRMRAMDAYIGVRGADNSLELSDVPAARMAAYEEHWWKPVHSHRINRTRWVVLRYPTPSFAQAAGMSTAAFEDFYFRVCTLDYARMEAAQQPLAERMRRADRVRIVGPGTDLSFSITGIGAQICAGQRNIPDGECYTCPVRESVNGVIQFNVPTLYQGVPFENIRLVLSEGQVVEATGSDTARLNAILDSDEGARYIGEFSLGFNPHILKPMRDTLFDEKIAGSFHFTPGQAYEGVGNGNQSQIHWDMVCIQRPEFGGGDIWFDNELIRRDGRFVPDDLQGLNPEALA